MTAVQPEEITAAIRVSANLDKTSAERGLNLSKDQEAMLGSFRDHLNQNRAQEALQSFATGLPGGWKAISEQTMLTSFDKDGKRTERTPAEKTRLAEVQEKTAIYEKYQTSGFDGLSASANGNGQSEQQSLKDEVRSLITSNPVLFEALKDSSNAIPDVVIVEVLKDKGVQGQLSEILNGAYTGVDIIQLEQDLLAAKAEKDSLIKKRDLLEPERAKLEASLNTITPGGIKESEEAFKNTPYSADGKSKGQVLDELRNNDLITDYFDLQGQLKELKQQMAQLSTKSPAYSSAQTTIGEIQTQLQEYIKNPDKRKTLREFQSLDLESRKIQESRTTTQQRLDQLTAELLPLDGQVAQTNAKLNSLESQRIQVAENFEATVKNALSRAVDQNMTSKVRQAINEFGSKKQGFKAQQQEAKTAEEAAAKAKAEKNLPRRKEIVMKYLDQRYIEHVGKGKIQTNASKTKIDFEKLLDPNGGPDALAQQIIGDLTASTGLHTSLGLTAEDIAEMANDRDLITSLSADVPKQVLTAVVASRIPINQETSTAILMTSWGENLVQPVLDRVNKIKGERETLSLATTGNKVGEFAAKHPIWGMLLLLVSLGILGPAVLQGIANR